MVVGLERCPEYGIGYCWYLVYNMGFWMAWKGTSCTDWNCGCVWKGVWSTVRVVVGTRCAKRDCGWLGKVPYVRHGILDGLEMCPEYSLVDDC
jgi:hypothetical protein